MANCTNIPYSINGLNIACKDSSLGGIKAVYVGGFDEVIVTPNSGSTVADKNTVTVTMSGSAKLKKYTLLKNSGNLVSEMQTSDYAAPTFQNSVVISFAKMEAKKRNEVMALLLTPSRVIVEDANGTLFLMGKDNYVEGVAGTGDTGTSGTDNNHYEITLQDISAELPFIVEMDMSIVDTSVNA